ncbi:MAG TPA: tRNA pseudouridine(38-40) synthase TruA [Tepidisphaeraceae bacterium]|nr:tRNA pseudouridine(38-40) synthase TruA [Tepidisphaeraceae bacterium]
MTPAPSQRYKVTIAYRGTRYHGWQAQSKMETYRGEEPPEGQGIPTIQETVSRALERVVRHPVNLVGSSRTDAGVHAKGQVAHFDTDQVQIPKEGIRRAANHQLPGDVFLKSIEAVPPTFDAVFSTASKRYQYSIWNSHARSVFLNDLTWHRWQKLDLDAMRAAAAHFVGTHDFASFARPGHGRENTVRTVLECDVSATGPRVVIGVHGTGFLWNMVRIMVGTLVQVGIHHYQPDDIPKMLEAKDRQSAGPTAPPHGLYLQWIRFRDAPKDGLTTETQRHGEEEREMQDAKQEMQD